MNDKKSKIFCIGANLEAHTCLKFLIENKCTIDGLITLPAGENKQVSDYYDLHDFCHEHAIKIVETVNVNSESTIRELKTLQPDVLFTLGWSQIFKKEFIQCFSKLIVGTHPTKLPYGRGRAPVPWTILENLSESAVSFFKIDEGVDTGKIIMQRAIKIPANAYVMELYEIVAKELSIGFLEIYRLIKSNQDIPLKSQSEQGVTIRGKRSPEDGLIDFNRSSAEIERLIRAVSKPYPGAYSYYKDTKIIFWETLLDHEKKYMGTVRQILLKSEIGILVQCSDDTLWLNRPTYDNGDPVDLKFFRIGDKLGYNVEDEIYKLKIQNIRDTTIQ